MYLFIKVHIALLLKKKKVFSSLFVSVYPFCDILGKLFCHVENMEFLSQRVSSLFKSLVYLIKLTTVMKVV